MRIRDAKRHMQNNRMVTVVHHGRPIGLTDPADLEMWPYETRVKLLETAMVTENSNHHDKHPKTWASAWTPPEAEKVSHAQRM